jgi:two-component system, chemotaxis family, chemotaxis protein CheY
MSYNLLIVDDSNIIRKSLIKALGMIGLDLGAIFEAGNGQEGLALLAKERVHLIFLDINMPVMNGVEFLQALRQIDGLRDLPVLIISTEGSQPRYDELEALGIQGVLRKPVRPEALAGTVETILKGLEND